MKNIALILGLLVCFPSISIGAEGLKKPACRVRFFMNSDYVRYKLPLANNRDDYWKEPASIASHRIAQFDDQPIALRFTIKIEACSPEDLHIKEANIQEFAKQFAIQFIDGRGRISLGQMPMSMLQFTKKEIPLRPRRVVDPTLWNASFDAVLPLQGTWYMSEFFVDRWLCFKIAKPGWAQRKPISTFPTCLMRWKPKNAEQEASMLYMRSHYLGRNFWGDSWEGSEEELFQERKRLYLRVNELDPTNGGGWSGLFSIYRKRGMMNEANQALDSWKALAPPDKHEMIEDIRAGRGRL